MVLAPTEWLVDPAIAYLNHGGYGVLPVPVADAARQWRAEVEANPTDVLFRRMPELLNTVRQSVARLLRGDARNLVFVANATAGTATVLSSLDLGRGDEVVTTDHRYPAVASQLGVISERRGIRVVETHVPVNVTHASEVVAAVMANVGKRTRLVALDQIASPTGFVFPVRELVAAAHAAGVPVLVDAAHAPGQVDVDLGAIDADFWVGNLHKWVCSPRACAVMHVAPQWQDRVRPLVASHGYFDGYQPAFDWTGTLDPVPILTVPDALEFWSALGWDEVRRQQRSLVTAGAQHVAAELGTRVATRDEFTAAMRLVELPRPVRFDDGVAISNRMTTEHKVTAYVTHHAGSSYVRMCGQLYNSPEDYARLADALSQLL